MERVRSNSSTASSTDPETLMRLVHEVAHVSKKVMTEDERLRAKAAEYQDVLDIGGISDSERADIEAKMSKLKAQIGIWEDHICDAEKDLELVLIELGKVSGNESSRGRSMQCDRPNSINAEEAEKLKNGLEQVLQDTLEVAEEQKQAKKEITSDSEADDGGVSSMAHIEDSTTGSSAPVSR